MPTRQNYYARVGRGTVRVTFKPKLLEGRRSTSRPMMTKGVSYSVKRKG